ncbi:MAG: hypothetical protein AAFN09_00120 [Pseudomonadota bacterium]
MPRSPAKTSLGERLKDRLGEILDGLAALPGRLTPEPDPVPVKIPVTPARPPHPHNRHAPRG